MWFGFKAVNNKTIFLQKELPNVLITGRITKVKEHPNSHLKSIYLTDLKYSNYSDDYLLPKDVKLVTFYKVYLKKDDIINTIANLQPIYALTPFKNHLKTKAFWDNIGAKGLVVSKIEFQKHISIKKNSIKEKITVHFQHIKDYFLRKINSYMSFKVVGVAEAITFGVNKNLTQIDRNNLQKSGLGPFISI